jgi:hypothetical protein
MSRPIIPGKQLVTPITYEQQQLPIDKPVAQYVRQSTMMQAKYYIQSKIEQDEKLADILTRMGFSTIVPIDADQGKSGQKREGDGKQERKGLKDLYRMIERGEVGAIAAYDASRFWRDETHVYDAMFIQRLIKHNIPVIMFSQYEGVRVYWMNREHDVEMLRQEFTYSAAYLKQIKRMNMLRKQSVQDSANYGGHSVPMGFLVVGEKGKPKHYVIYEPHAKLVRWIFKRYRALNGNLAKLRQEVLHTHIAFPPFAGVESIPHVSLRFVSGIGYPLKTRGSLVSILTNVAYIGHYLFDGVMQQNTHEAIVALDDFLYAYHRLSPITLDGMPNAQKPKQARTFVACDALLENILQHDTRKMYVSRQRQVYETKKADIPGSVEGLQVRIDMIDEAFTGQLLTVLLVLEDRHRKGVSDSLYEQLAAMQQETQEEGLSLTMSLQNVHKAIAGWELDKQSCRETGNINGLHTANLQLTKLYADRDAITLQIQETESEEADIEESMELTQQVIDHWDSLPFDVQRQYTQLIVHSATLTEAAPHFLRLDITLKPPFSTSMRGYIYRFKGTKAIWTDGEITTLQQLYPHADRLHILQALPLRTWDSIIQYASSKHIARTTLLDTSGIPTYLTYADMQFLQRIKQDLYFFPMQLLHDGFSVWKSDTDGAFHASYVDMLQDMLDTKQEGQSALAYQCLSYKQYARELRRILAA